MTYTNRAILIGIIAGVFLYSLFCFDPMFMMDDKFNLLEMTALIFGIVTATVMNIAGKHDE